MLLLYLCSLCNTKATSQQTLLLHAEGKKHRGKARAVHASKQQSMQKEEPDSHTKLPSETPQKIELLGNKDLKESESEDISQVNSAHHNLEIENGTLPLKKRRKSDRSEDDSSRKKAKDDTSVELGNGEVIQSGKTEKDKKEISTKRDNVLKSCFDKEETKKIKWKKLIKSVLKSVCIVHNMFSAFHFVLLLGLIYCTYWVDIHCHFFHISEVES